MLLSDTENHRRDCLARWLLDTWETKAECRASLTRMEKRHGREVVEDIRQRALRIHRERQQGGA